MRMNLSAVLLDNSSADRQAETCAGYLSPMQSLEKSNNALSEFWLESDSVV